MRPSLTIQPPAKQQLGDRWGWWEEQGGRSGKICREGLKQDSEQWQSVTGTLTKASSKHDVLQSALRPLSWLGMRSDSADSKSFVKKISDFRRFYKNHIFSSPVNVCCFSAHPLYDVQHSVTMLFMPVVCLIKCLTTPIRSDSRTQFRSSKNEAILQMRTKLTNQRDVSQDPFPSDCKIQK